MSRAYMPLYVGDFLADTMHLGATETGIYIRLIMHCWQHGSIPIDARKQALIAHIDPRRWHRYRDKILAFFEPACAPNREPVLAHNRVSKERARYSKLSNVRKEAALHMHMQRRSKLHANAGNHTIEESESSPTSEPNPSINPSEHVRSTDVDRAIKFQNGADHPKPKPAKLNGQHGPPDGWEAFWAEYPRKIAKAAAEKSYRRALKKATAEKILTELQRQKSQWDDQQYIPHPATWLNQERWNDEPAPTKQEPYLV